MCRVEPLTNHTWCHPWPAEFVFRVLGSPSTEWRSQPLCIPRRQARALLYHLETGLRHGPRERLRGLLWPDVPDATARSNLSRLLNQLRRALAVPELLVASNDQVGLGAPRCWSDTAAFGRPVTSQDTSALQETVEPYPGPCALQSEHGGCAPHRLCHRRLR